MSDSTVRRQSIAMIDRLIMDQIGVGARVLDMGCGDGRLLCRLRDEKSCSIQGIELDHDQVLEAIAKGVPVLQADLDDGLGDIPEDAFDFAVLSETLQQVRHPKELLGRMMRVARRALVVVPNFAHWMVRIQLLVRGSAPRTPTLPYDWYDTPNLHLVSIRDFARLADNMGLTIERQIPIIHGKGYPGAWAANLRADSALFLLQKPHRK